jgi:hypothetical protein
VRWFAVGSIKKKNNKRLCPRITQVASQVPKKKSNNDKNIISIISYEISTLSDYLGNIKLSICFANALTITTRYSGQ